MGPAMTPLMIQMLLHFYARNDQFPDIEYSAQQEAAEFLRGEALICRDLSSDHIGRIYRLLPRGRAHVAQILGLALPRCVFVDAHGAEIPT